MHNRITRRHSFVSPTCANRDVGPEQHKVNVNVNVHVYSPDIPVGSADCTIYTPGIGTHSFTVSSPLGENSAFAHFAAAIANHYNLAFSFHQVPITAGWTEAS